MDSLQRWVALSDIHAPEYDRPTWRAILSYIKQNPLDGVILTGDQLDLGCISHWNRNKPGVKTKGNLQKDLEKFEREILTPLEELLPKHCQKVWIMGNHERFLTDLSDEMPELFGMFDIVKYFRLKERGWVIVGLGKRFKLGKLDVIHGDTLTGGLTAARKALEVYGGNVLLGHFHNPQSASKASPTNVRKKAMAWVAPIVGSINPGWVKRRANNWLNGFTLIDVFQPSGSFNLYPVIVTSGQFGYAGKIYR
jgi:predicted phosphodiesterase